MPTTFSSLLSLANIAVILLTAAIGCPQVANAVNVHLFAESGCPADNPGPYYYTGAIFEGLEEIANSTTIWTWNIVSRCGYVIGTYGPPIPLPTARASVNGSASVGAPANAFPECRGSVAPDVYHIKLSADSPAIPIARKVALEMMASVAGAEQGLDAMDIGELVDRETGVVKREQGYAGPGPEEASEMRTISHTREHAVK